MGSEQKFAFVNYAGPVGNDTCKEIKVGNPWWGERERERTLIVVGQSKSNIAGIETDRPIPNLCVLKRCAVCAF